jgi:hypothetical protein
VAVPYSGSMRGDRTGLRKLINVGPAWYSEGSSRTFVSYLRCVRRQPGFPFAILAALIFAAAGFKSLSVAEVMGIYGGALVALIGLGYLVWRRVVRS